MPHPIKPTRFWLIAFVGLVIILWALKPMLLPFVAGMVLAYFLDPVVDRLAIKKIPRWLGTVTVLSGFILFLVFLLLLIIPLLKHQVAALIHALPAATTTFEARFLPWLQHWMDLLSEEDIEKLRQAASQYAGNAVGLAGDLVKKILSEGVALFDIVTLFVITPVVAFYLLRDWPKITQTIDSLLPRAYYSEIKDQMGAVDRALSGFIRGQALVCLCLGLIYSTGLSVVGLKYGATVGIIAGALSFIPYVGSTFGCVVSLLLAFVQFDEPLRISLVFAVFLTGQILEGYVLTPKLVGDRVGLHPVWILFALFAGGSLMGFTGVLIAVPMAAILGVLCRHAIYRYTQSSFYKKQDLCKQDLLKNEPS